MYQHFQVSIDEYIARVNINRPEKANALHREAWEELQTVFEALDQDDEVRVIVLSGEGKHFCAGMDLEVLMNIQQFQTIDCEGRKREKLRQFILRLQAMVSALEACRKPVLAAVSGACVGGGLDIIAACDMRYCSEDAYFSIKEIDLGMVADLGSLQRLPRIIGPGMTAELAYTGRNVSGREAAQIGLVNQCYSDREALEAGVLEIARSIAQKSPLSVRGIKEVMLYARDHSVADSLQQISIWNAAMFLSKDLEEAFLAAQSRRPPKFQ
ncbi:crotonase/enoyl-CoA hydratase family protein [Flavilitoribacter nigricans]|uniref:Enoyl-CoA hydratase n=1 Tax=Flavilitoribacter nigricans (strain ATCC 23147 / DSM 23189 / NBRC 102662 / NCIMB 1420 / SS-2) TaxID=1122177 RepID=A0A2D0N981_FLAN2|nr:crotonase/enoyl-CoA hydratase family protein [Flavilitoribacter nigricans]PHN05081.1 enoyl-CoA hydratase [Flavilitoribacter nigricans DSM 23189 = NBRC 102662]